MSTANPTRVLTPECRISYPAVFQPKAVNEGDDPKYSVEMIFPKDADLSVLKAAAKAAIAEKWGDKPPKGLKNPFRDGDSEREEKDGYENSIFIGARSNSKPAIVIGPGREPLMDQNDFYGGCYAVVSVTAFAYDKGVNKGVTFALNNIWKTRDGEPFGNRRTAEEDFADVDPSAYGFDETVDSFL